MPRISANESGTGYSDNWTAEDQARWDDLADDMYIDAQFEGVHEEDEDAE
jgi:hypothetical protein